MKQICIVPFVGVLVAACVSEGADSADAAVTPPSSESTPGQGISSTQDALPGTSAVPPTVTSSGSAGDAMTDGSATATDSAPVPGVSGPMTQDSSSNDTPAVTVTSGEGGASLGGAGASPSEPMASAGTSATLGDASNNGGAPNTGGAVSSSDDAGTALGGAGSAMGEAGAGPTTPTEPFTVFIAGDSTVQTYQDTASTTDQAGWGQMLHEYVSDLVTVDNRAIGGRTARRFIDEGRLAEIAAEIVPGDYLLVQFGTNDQHTTATYEIDGETIPYYLDPETDFKEYLKQYIEVASNHDATLVFVTPPPRNSAYCTGGNGTAAHAQAMRELGEAEGIPVADLNKKVVDHLQAICPSPTPEDFFLVRADGSVDGTHFQENGARIMAGFVFDGIGEAGLGLGALTP